MSTFDFVETHIHTDIHTRTLCKLPVYIGIIAAPDSTCNLAAKQTHEVLLSFLKFSLIKPTTTTKKEKPNIHIKRHTPTK